MLPGSRSSRSRLAAVVFSLCAHLALLCLVLVSVKPDLVAPPPAAPPLVVPMEIVPPPPQSPVTPEPAKPSPAKAAPAKAPTKAPAKKALARPTPTPTRVAALPAGPIQGSDYGVSDSELSGAAVAGGGGSGTGGATCDMAARLRDALRKDTLVRAAAAKAGAVGNHAIRVWNGDWVQSTGDDGKGLQAAREAILWEVGFAPAACREQAVRGLIVITMNDAPGSAKIVLGKPAWRWSDVLGRR
jgi:hypothetical protein